MKLMNNTAAFYPMGAGCFKPWLFVNCCREPVAVDKESRLETSRTHWIESCSIAHQFHVVSTDAAMSLYGIKDFSAFLSTQKGSCKIGVTAQQGVAGALET